MIVYSRDELKQSVMQHSDKYQNGITGYGNGNYQLAVQEFEEILTHDWESPELYYNLGNAYYRQKIL